jgi:hypothetical protein
MMGDRVMATSYEWDIESFDGEGDITDHDHRGRLSEYKVDDLAAAIKGDAGTRLVLVRDAVDRDRGWAYVVNGKLPEDFLNANDEIVAPVPSRFHLALKVALLELHTKALPAMNIHQREPKS